MSLSGPTSNSRSSQISNLLCWDFCIPYSVSVREAATHQSSLKHGSFSKSFFKKIPSHKKKTQNDQQTLPCFFKELVATSAQGCVPHRSCALPSVAWANFSCPIPRFKRRLVLYEYLLPNWFCLAENRGKLAVVLHNPTVVMHSNVQ